MDINTLIRIQNERATNYCKTCGGSGRIKVMVTGSKIDFSRCCACNGTGLSQKFRDRTNKEKFENHSNKP